MSDTRMTGKEFMFEIEVAKMMGDRERFIQALLRYDRYQLRPIDIARFGEWEDWAEMLRETLGTSKADAYGNPWE